MRKLVLTLATTGALIAAAPATADAKISLRYFDIAPTCVTPGSTITARTGITQSEWWRIDTLWSRVQVSQAGSGLVVYQQDRGPQYVPYGSYDDTSTAVVPSNAPTGDYNVTLLLGSTQGGSQWATATRPLKVRALQVLCNVS